MWCVMYGVGRGDLCITFFNKSALQFVIYDLSIFFNKSLLKKVVILCSLYGSCKFNNLWEEWNDLFCYITTIL